MEVHGVTMFIVYLRFSGALWNLNPVQCFYSDTARRSSRVIWCLGAPSSSCAPWGWLFLKQALRPQLFQCSLALALSQE